ncbi:MAG: 4Fe-4S dicluster domain-containing protein [Deltaproteobacteria bacterium]|nr:4Fe-4S dicluster domain-containing protein [Deltaproteobacteria bacterium]
MSEGNGKEGAPRKAPRVDRRTVLRSGAAALMGCALVTGAARKRNREKRPPEPRASISPSCVGCTGCAAVCPKAVITAVPGGIAIDEEKCIRCGYCEAVCPVAGVRIGREASRG